MNYAGIKYTDIANGLGCRTVLFVSGCRNHCKDCFQPHTWDFNYGEPFDEKVQQDILDSLKPAYVQGLTLLGGERMSVIGSGLKITGFSKANGTFTAEGDVMGISYGGKSLAARIFK